MDLSFTAQQIAWLGASFVGQSAAANQVTVENNTTTTGTSQTVDRLGPSVSPHPYTSGIPASTCTCITKARMGDHVLNKLLRPPTTGAAESRPPGPSGPRTVNNNGGIRRLYACTYRLGMGPKLLSSDVPMHHFPGAGEVVITYGGPKQKRGARYLLQGGATQGSPLAERPSCAIHALLRTRWQRLHVQLLIRGRITTFRCLHNDGYIRWM